MDDLYWLEENGKPEFSITREKLAELRNAVPSGMAESYGENVVQWGRKNAKPEFRLVPREDVAQKLADRAGSGSPEIDYSKPFPWDDTQDMPDRLRVGDLLRPAREYADAGTDSDDDLWNAPMSEHFKGAEKLLRPAHEYADAWNEMYEEATSELQKWIDQEPGAWPLAAAMQTAMDLGKLDVDALRLGKGMAEGDARGIIEDGLRATGIASQVVSAGKLLDPDIFKPFWKYYSFDPKSGKQTLPVYDEAGILKDNVWLARGKKPPYSLSEAADKLQLPLPVVTKVERVKVPWYRPVRGPRRVFDPKNADFGKGGGVEYLTGPSWDEAKNLEFTKLREWFRENIGRSQAYIPE